MKSKSITVYTIIIAAVFGLSIFFFAFSTIREYRTGFTRTGSMFDHLVAGTRNTALTYDSNSKEFQSTFEQLTGPTDNYNSLVLSKNNLPIYTVGTGEHATSSKFQKQYTESFSVNGDNYKITASMYLLRPSSLFYFSRFSFFIVLVATILTLILILYLHLSQNKLSVETENIDEAVKKEEEKNQDERYSVDQIYFTSDFLKNSQPQEPTTNKATENVSTANESTTNTVTENIVAEKEEKPENQKTAEPATKEHISAGQTKADVSEKTETKTQIKKEIKTPVAEEHISTEATKIVESDTAKAEIKTTGIGNSLLSEVLYSERREKTPSLFSAEKIKPPVEEAAPQGLFSPITGFGWEQYLETRLDSELIRATSSESDLSLFMIRIPGLLLTDPLSKIVCMYLQQQFQYNDLLFEYKQDGFSIIRENISVDDSLVLAETLHTEIMKIIGEKGYNCYIGLSTRSVRILPGSRLILEASEALRHAVESNDSPIFAFKANDEKYREYIESKV